MKIYRQGDVLLVEARTLPKDAIAVPRGSRGVVLAEGEATGHAHVLHGENTVLYQTPGKKARHLRVVKVDNLLHEEHTAQPIAPGIYRVVIQTEFRDKGLVRVAD